MTETGPCAKTGRASIFAAPPTADLLEMFYRALVDGKAAVHYQPVLDRRDGAPRHVEALVRCPDETGAYIPNRDLIPALGDEIHACALGVLVFRRVLEQMSAWRRIGLDLRVSVNLLPGQLTADCFVEWLIAEVAQQGATPDDLLLEIDETRYTLAGPDVQAGMHKLVARGFDVVVDGFGPGGANPDRLRNIGVRTLKSDRWYGMQLGTEDGRQLMAAMSGFCAAHGFALVVTGVESAVAADFLVRLGLSSAQGFHFATPMDAGACTDWLRGVKGVPA